MLFRSFRAPIPQQERGLPITGFVNGVKFFTAKNALRGLAELSNNRTRFLSVSPRKFEAGRNSFGNFQNFV
jgi:hypothetical protein